MNKIFSFLPNIFGTVLSDMELTFGSSFTTDLKKYTKPVILGGFAYVKHVKNALFADDLDIKIKTLPDVSYVNRKKYCYCYNK